MNIGFDFDGTITKNPWLFKQLIDMFRSVNGVRSVYIISGTSHADRHKLLNELKAFNITVNPENIITKPESGNISDVTMWKYNLVDELKIRLYIENREETAVKLSELCTIFKII